MLRTGFGRARPEVIAERLKVEFRRSEFHAIVLWATVAVIAFIAGHLGGTSRVDSWGLAAGNVAVIAVAFIMAVALLRLADAMALRHGIAERSDASRDLAADTRAILEQGFPGAIERSRHVDAAALLSRGMDRDASSRSNAKM
jgi:hypothetical protein